MGALICVMLVFVAVTEHGPKAIFFYLFSSTIAAVLVSVFRREAALLQNYVSAVGTLTAYKKRRRGRDIKYRFRAIEGKSYEGESSLWSLRDMREGGSVVVFYKPLDPTLNLPLPSFMFYSFTSLACDAESVEGKISEKT